jgi:hypothetical protein
VSQDIADGHRVIKHSGTRDGYLYRIAEPIDDDDVYPHPTTTMGPGQEWLIRRELRVELIEPTVIRPDELLTPDDVEQLRHRAGHA